MALPTLLRQASPLADPREQLRQLARCDVPRFDEMLQRSSCGEFRARSVEVLQVNVGRVCNQTCRHCHVDAGPERRESMSREVAEVCLRLLDVGDIATLDVTGGAPEMNPHFRWMVAEGRRLNRRVIDRCNLTILMAPGFTDLAEFLAEHDVEVVASLPCYLAENVDRQRGAGVFEASIEAIRRLNSLGYGAARSLTLVYNPAGPSLPPDQSKLEADYRRELRARYGIEFTRLHAIANLPISRFLDDLLRQNRLDEYLSRLVAAFNPAAVDSVMCRTLLSVDWRGRLFDCDFNQMLDMPLVEQPEASILGLTTEQLAALATRRIAVHQHCYGCTAGAGSSCFGSLKP